MTEGNNHINYSSADIEKYRKGLLPAIERHAMEKAALDDPFLADAMEGYGAYNEEATPAQNNVENDILDLRQRLAGRINEKEKTPLIKFSWWKVAAILIVLIGAGWLYNSINNKAKEETFAKNEDIKIPSPSSVKKDSNANPPLNADTLSALNDLAIAEKKQPAANNTNNYNYTPTDKYKKSASDSLPVTGGISVAEAPVAKNKEFEKDFAKTNAGNNNNAGRQAAATKAGENKGFVAAADKRGKAVSENDDAGKAASGRAYTENTFRGNVVDQSNKPLANASIQVPQLNIAAQTDNNGFFSFTAPDTALSASVASAGFETQKINLQNNIAFNQVILKPAQNNMNEVVVVGYESKKKQTLKKDLSGKVQDAEPVIGLNEYDEYLEKNKRVSDEAKNIHGSVVVSFEVRSKGLSNFKIEQSIKNEFLDQEAIRLIKDGPAWKLLKGKKAKATIIVKF